MCETKAWETRELGGKYCGIFRHGPQAIKARSFCNGSSSQRGNRGEPQSRKLKGTALAAATRSPCLWGNRLLPDWAPIRAKRRASRINHDVGCTRRRTLMRRPIDPSALTATSVRRPAPRFSQKVRLRSGLSAFRPRMDDGFSHLPKMAADQLSDEPVPTIG